MKRIKIYLSQIIEKLINYYNYLEALRHRNTIIAYQYIAWINKLILKRAHIKIIIAFT